MGATSPALARQGPAHGPQGIGMPQATRRAKRLEPTTASLRSTLIGAVWPKIGLQPLTTSPC